MIQAIINIIINAIKLLDQGAKKREKKYYAKQLSDNKIKKSFFKSKFDIKNRKITWEANFTSDKSINTLANEWWEDAGIYISKIEDGVMYGYLQQLQSWRADSSSEDNILNGLVYHNINGKITAKKVDEYIHVILEDIQIQHQVARKESLTYIVDPIEKIAQINTKATLNQYIDKLEIIDKLLCNIFKLNNNLNK